jgi:hypothetical protein
VFVVPQWSSLRQPTRRRLGLHGSCNRTWLRARAWISRLTLVIVVDQPPPENHADSMAISSCPSPAPVLAANASCHWNSSNFVYQGQGHDCCQCEPVSHAWLVVGLAVGLCALLFVKITMVFLDFLVRKSLEEADVLGGAGGRTATLSAANTGQTYRVFSMLALTSNESQILDFLRTRLRWPSIITDWWRCLTYLFSLYLPLFCGRSGVEEAIL